MRRAVRHAFTLLSALSLLLCVAAVVLWVDSYFLINDRLLYDRQLDSVDHRVTIRSWNGDVFIRVGPKYGYPAYRIGVPGIEIQPLVDGGYRGFVQYGFVVTLTMIPVVWWIVRRTRPRENASTNCRPAAASGSEFW